MLELQTSGRNPHPFFTSPAIRSRAMRPAFAVRIVLHMAALSGVLCRGCANAQAQSAPQLQPCAERG